jgi:hypothetical protein
MTETPTLYFVQHSYEFDGWDRPQWNYEDASDTLDRGYFTSREDAEDWITTEKQRRIAEGRAKNDTELANKNANAQRAYEEKRAVHDVRRAEYDALVAAGLDPSFDRPIDRGPFKPQQSHFDEDVYLKGLRLDWEVIEANPYKKDEEGT